MIVKYGGHSVTSAVKTDGMEDSGTFERLDRLLMVR